MCYCSVYIGPVNGCVCLLQGYAWMYRFSQLKGSSDNGESRLTLQFAGEQSKDLQSQVCMLDLID